MILDPELAPTVVGAGISTTATLDVDGTRISGPAVTSLPGATMADALAIPVVARGADPDPGTGPLRVGQAFSARYHIIKTLGVGGMGAVYQAWDAELGEAVAIKVIRPEVMANPAAGRELETRFKRELQLARQVTHTNVVRIHDLGEIDGIKYITMSYVDGTDLASLLTQEGSLTPARTLAILRSVLPGLLAAHAVGVVHRDLKPGNIMIRKDGEALLMDFGVARSRNTRHDGELVGTTPYMAPEQSRGEEVDERADLYSLGLILYDMLAWRHRAKHATNAFTELESRKAQAPTPIHGIVPAVPAPFGDVIARCLEPDREKRFPTTHAFADALARLDDEGRLLPVKRVVGLPVMVAVTVLLLGAVAGTYWYQQQFIAPPKHDPVSVLIADLRNTTGDPGFDGTLEPMMKRALEGAGFITAYDRNGLRGLGVRRRDHVDEAAAREIAVKQGLGVVIAGSIAAQDSGYRIAMRASQTVAGTEITSQEARASTKDEVLDTVTRLVTRVRRALGDHESESAQQFAMASISATSLDVVGLYAKAMEAQSGNRFEEALQYASKAVARDPKFGIGYLVEAVASRTLGRMDDNTKYVAQALSHLDGMTERERYQVRGYSHLSAGDYEQCVREFSELIGRYPSDVAGHNQLALCLSNQRKMRRAMDEMQAVVKILPSHPLFRDNLALYANYAGDFEAAELEARQVDETDAYARLAIAFAQTGQGQFDAARETYQGLAKLGAMGGSFAASGLGDLAAVAGRFSEAAQILQKGAAADLAAGNKDASAAKLAAAAYAELSRGRFKQAIETADEALRRSSAVKIRFLAARTLIEAGDAARATPIVESLGSELYAEPRAYARQLQGLTELTKGEAARAMTLLREAGDLFDTWAGHFDLGRASLAAGAYAQADSAFDVCLNARRGEALALFVDEEPTYAYLPQVYYYQGLTREGLKNAGAADAFKQYLAIRGASTEDPLVARARERVR